MSASQQVLEGEILPKAVGRPLMTIHSLPKDWQPGMIAAATMGKSELSIRVQVLNGIAHDTWERLIKDEPEFSETVMKCRALIQDWWEELGRKGATTEVPVNPTMWIFNMKNRFGWKDQQHLSIDGEQILDRTIKRLDGSIPEEQD